jgi:hypothetical protein
MKWQTSLAYILKLDVPFKYDVIDGLYMCIYCYHQGDGIILHFAKSHCICVFSCFFYLLYFVFALHIYIIIIIKKEKKREYMGLFIVCQEALPFLLIFAIDTKSISVFTK